MWVDITPNFRLVGEGTHLCVEISIFLPLLEYNQDFFLLKRQVLKIFLTTTYNWRVFINMFCDIWDRGKQPNGHSKGFNKVILSLMKKLKHIFVKTSHSFIIIFIKFIRPINFNRHHTFTIVFSFFR